LSVQSVEERHDATQEPAEKASDPHYHTQGGSTTSEWQFQEQGYGPDSQECGTVGQQGQRTFQATTLAVSADGPGHRAKDRPTGRQEHEAIVAILVDPVLCNPIRQTGEAEPDAQEHPEMAFRELVLENSHGWPS
jgi:hypothetical protein